MLEQDKIDEEARRQRDREMLEDLEEEQRLRRIADPLAMNEDATKRDEAGQPLPRPITLILSPSPSPYHSHPITLTPSPSPYHPHPITLTL